MRGMKSKMKTVLRTITGLALIGILTAQPFAFAGTINDIEKGSNYAKPAILALAERNIIEGDGQGNFNPLQTVTRERIVTMVARAYGLDTSHIPSTATFRDVPVQHWAYPYIEAAYRDGLIRGVSQDLFGLGQPCSREQMAAIIVRASDKGQSQENGTIDHISGYKDFLQISGWAKDYVNRAVERKLMSSTGNSNFSPRASATMEQSAVVIDRLIDSMNNGGMTDNGITVTLNGDRINTDAVAAENGEILVPVDFLKYFQGDYMYNAGSGLIFAAIMPAAPANYIESWAKVNSREAYVFTKASVNEVPFDNPGAYARNKTEYSVPPQLIRSVLYLPADFVADATGSDYRFDAKKNVLTWTDQAGSDYPTLLAALKSKVYQYKQEIRYSLKADFKDRRGGNHMNYDFKTEGQFDMSSDMERSNYHVINDKLVMTDILNGSDLDRHEKSETVKIGSDLYVKNAKTGQYELTDRYAGDTGSPEYGFVSHINSALYHFFIRYRDFEAYNNVKMSGQITTKYVLRLSDVNDIAYFFGDSYSATVAGDKITYKKFHPSPLPRYYYAIESFFLGKHWDRTVDNDYTGYPVYSDCSAKIEIYVNAQDEIVKEVLSNSGNRYDYMVPSGGFDQTDRVYRDVDYNFIYEIAFQPFTGTIRH